MGFALALTVGLISGIIPAVGAMRLRVVDALRRV
jgi:ABC-type antimicrobial peptide transport system permease subunit